MRWLLGALGLAAIGYGGYGLLVHDRADLIGVFGFLVTALVAHDFVVLPVVVGLGALVARFVPAWGRRPVIAALVVSAAVTAVALPLIIGKGRIADNPSAFPQRYGPNLLLIVAVVWSVAAVWGLVAWRRRARS
jgi:hypothetical protein